uniref:Branched-chain amino acid transport system substrate-binding protein n=1 Tax=Acetithermum autotrophicum TaxID=1446466 RepID=H5SQY8_ACEAU|nr:branched-chain amino acid transport system substrate-binding protein [Candidatus Acetothermum autotrophicum]
MKRIWLMGVVFVLIAGLLFSSGLTQQQLPKEIVIGGPISLAGTYAKEGQQGYWGFLVAEKWVNEVYGGVRIQGQRIPIKYKYYDDESKKENVTSLLERLITVDGVKFLLAPYSSGLTLAGAPVAEKYKALYNSHGGASDRIFEQGYKYAVQTIGLGSRYQLSAIDMVRTIDTNAKKFALLFEDDEFSRIVMKGAKDYLTKLGFQIVFERTYPSGVKDLTPALTELQAAAPEILLGGGHFADGQLLAKQMGDLGIAVKAASLVVAPTLPAFAEALGKQANGFLGPAHWEMGAKFSPETVPQGMEYFGPPQEWFIEEFKKISKGVDPEYHAADAIAAILVYVKAIEKANSLDVDKVRAAMNDLHFYPFYGEWQIEPETGKQIGHKMVLIQWQNNKKVIVWPPEAQTGKPCYPMAQCPGR